MKPLSRRSVIAGSAAVVTAIPGIGLATAVKAAHGEDLELRQLWADYLTTLGAMRKAESILSPARVPYEAEFKALRDGYPQNYGDLHDLLWKKHGLAPLARAVNREHRKLIRLAKAIRKAKTGTLFGVGVKLSVSEHFEEWDAVEANEDARRTISVVTGIDFIAATCPLLEDYA